MRKQRGITLVSLTITIVVMIILTSITTYIGTDLIRQVKLQDLKTNMLLIQAEAKKAIEEAKFQKVETIDEGLTENILIGVALQGSGKPESEASGKIDGDIANYCYLSEEALQNLGIKELDPEKYGYFIVKYDLENIKVDVINTKGYKGHYKLEEINNLSEE